MRFAIWVVLMLGLDAEGMVGLGAGAMGLGEDMACLGANLYFSAMD